jgi:hypothetical protein
MLFSVPTGYFSLIIRYARELGLGGGADGVDIQFDGASVGY